MKGGAATSCARFLASMIGSLAVTLALGACGTTGGTNRQTVAVPAGVSAGTLAPVEVAPVLADPAGIALVNVGTFAWGRFDEADRVNIEASLRDSIAAARGERPAGGTPVRVHVLIRSYVVGTSNNAAAVWAAVDWCVADAERVLFQELFYATGSARFIGTVGGVKDEVQRAVVARVTAAALAVAAGLAPSAKAVGTYASFDEAAATMPETLRSWGLVALMGPGIPVVIPGTGPQRFPLERLKITEPTDWTARLQRSVPGGRAP